MRSLVDSVPAWGLVLLFVGGLILLSGVSFLVGHRLDFRSPSTGADTMVSSFSARVTTLFGILLVFVIVAEYQGFQEAERTVRREASGLAEILRSTESFPRTSRDRIRGAVASYGNEVVHGEWPLMSSGRSSAAASSRLDGIQHALAGFDPRTESDKAFYGSAVGSFDDVVDARRDRIQAAESDLPTALLALLFAGAIAFVLTMFAFSPAKDSLLLGMIVVLAALAGAGLFATVVLDYPFTGSIRISTAPFHEGALAPLIRP